ncbi:Dynein regulatory complex subunit 5 [Araneus ventricosus]|uniref:Dynein regulatory complex subunit 5 n=1 Tax=Araneus ventricosus TaxID=182803 RepID=A0A4Y2BQ73_ARAVE|nr:Dynein regulatory complex subunit 5 [Araneus ventricosus]
MLVNICKNIVNDIPGEQLRFLFQPLNEKQKKTLSNLFPLNLPIDLLLTFPLDEVYWKRKCCDKQWTHLNYWLSNCSWKNTFVSCSVVDIIDSFITGKSSFAEVKTSLFKFQNYLYVLKINGFKFNYSNNNHKYLPIEDFVFQLVSLFPNLKEIYLNNFPLNYEMLLESNDCDLSVNNYEMLSKTLGKIQNLEKFNLLGTKMEKFQFSCIIDSLTALNTLTDVDLSCNLITDDFCDSISKLLNSQLEVLKLSNNQITNSGVKTIIDALSNNKSLKILHLDHNSIGDEGAINIFQCLISNISLFSIDLAYNKFTTECELSLCKLLERNSALQHLNLTGNNLEQETGWKIYKAVQSNRRILYLGFQFCGFSSETEDLIHLQISQNHQNSCQGELNCVDYNSATFSLSVTFGTDFFARNLFPHVAISPPTKFGGISVDRSSSE